MATVRVAIVALAFGALVATGCDDAASAPIPREPADGIARLGGRAPVLGIAEPNAWRRVPAPASADRVAASLAALGADSQRFVVDWNVVEPAPPQGAHRYRFEAFDAMYEADLRHGIRPLLVALNAPVWAADPGAQPGSGANNPPAASHLDDWADFLTALARRYPRAIGIEIWNEPNLATFWGSGRPGVSPDPRRYAALLARGYDAIKAVRPRMLVVGGALSPTPVPPPPGNVPPATFAREALEAGAAAHMDALSLHPYPSGGGVARTQALIDEVRAARDRFGAEMPLWLTEVGVTTTGPRAVDEAEQASLLVAICRAVARAPDVAALYVHNLIEAPLDSGFESGYGLMQPLPGGALRAKPAFEALRREFSVARSCGAAR